MRLVALLLGLIVHAHATAELLPEAPSKGLRITVSVSCDFSDRWWEATLYPGNELPLEFQAGERATDRRIDPDARAALYALAREAFEEFRIDRRPRFQGPGSERPWTGERTITLTALTLDDELGRVDRVELALDVMRGRALPAATLRLVDEIAEYSRLATLGVRCD